MAPLLEQPANYVLSLLRAGAPRRIIGLAGLPGAGKSTLAAHLAEMVNACTAPNTLVALGMDGFHFPKAALRQLPNVAEAFARRGAPWTFDTTAFYQRLQALRSAAGQHETPWPGFEHAVGDPVEAACSVPASTPLVLVEGLYLLHQADGWAAISQFFDERWYLDIPLEVAMQRLALRHRQVWGMTQREAEQRIATSDRLNADTVLQSAAFADWRISG